MKQSYICRTWKKKHGDWCSGFDRFDTLQEAIEHGEAFVNFEDDGHAIAWAMQQ